MITRRWLLASGAAFVAAPAHAQLRAGSYRIGILWGGSAWTRENNPWFRAFVEELEKRGYVEGSNLAFEVRSAEGDDKRLPDLAAELLATGPDVILESATPPLMALAKQNPTVPIVFAIGVDPIKLGLAQSLSHPGGSFTGFFNNAGDILPKSLQTLRDLLPQAQRFGYLLDMSFGATAVSRATISAAAQSLGFEVKFVEVRPNDNMTAAFDQFTEFKADAFLATGGLVWSRQRRALIELTRSRRLPAVFPFRMDAADGALMSYGSDMDALFRGAAGYVDRILQGANPGELPIEQATKLILIINLKTSREMGLQIPPLLFARATELIE